MKVRVRFRFNDLKFIRFRFGSGSPKKSGFYRFAVQVRVRFDSLLSTQYTNAINHDQFLSEYVPFTISIASMSLSVTSNLFHFIAVKYL